ncbi:MAG TPA: glycosyltransferase [Gemmatimonadaceae bacterium]|nr:glycosyltransferase [Gemmatimonadaceae bacterium]
MSSPQPRVSVIIPCYSQAHLLPEAVESALAQSGASVEIVVVDDGSPDDVRAVVNRYPSVRYVRQSNRGLSAARNTGLRESTGEFLVFVDSDDRLLPGALAAGLACFARNPDSAFVYGDFRFMSEEGGPRNRRVRPPLEVDLYGGMLVRNHIEMISTVLFRRNVLVKEGAFDTSLRSAEDYDLLLRLARRYPTSFHRELVAEYRRYEHKGKSLSQNPAVMLRSTMLVLRAQHRFTRGNEFYERQLAEGTRFFQDFYGGELVSEVRALVRRHRWLPALRGTAVLLRYYRRGIIERILRRARTGIPLAHG